MVRVLLIGNMLLGRIQLATMLAAEKDVDIVGHLGVENDTAIRAAHFCPHVIVINTDYMVSQLLPMVTELRSTVGGAAVLVLADPGQHGMLPPRRRAHHLSFLVKDAPVPLLAATIRRLANGEQVIQAQLEVAALAVEKPASTRELEVLGLAAEGESVAEIADRLRLAPGTVRNYLSAIIAKTGARNRIDAIRIIRKDGWLR